MKKSFVAFAVAAVVIFIGIGAYFMLNAPVGSPNPAPSQEIQTPAPEQGSAPAGNQPANPPQDNSATGQAAAAGTQNSGQEVIGKSAGGRDIIAYHYGGGNKEILFVAGSHGGYDWNTSVLAYQIMDYLKTNPDAVPVNVKATFVPVLNPDGLSKVVSATGPFTAADVSESQAEQIAGRYNADNVDINRNFDCDWKATGTWQNKPVSGGTAPFSEPEAQAIRVYRQNHKISAVVAWYSSGGGVYASSCGTGILPEMQTILDLYATAAEYPAHTDFTSYELSGDMTNWFAKNSVPAIGVILSSHNGTEYDKNLTGVKAVLDYYAEQ